MHEKQVTVATFWDPTEAGLLRAQLEEAGIRAHLLDEQMVSMMWHLTNAVGGVKVVIRESDLEAACQILDAREADDPEGEAEIASASDDSTESEPPDGLVHDDADEPDHVPTEREENADRALRAAMFGLFLVPLLFYVTWLLWKILVSDEEMQANKRRSALAAAAINLPMLVAIGIWAYSI